MIILAGSMQVPNISKPTRTCRNFFDSSLKRAERFWLVPMLRRMKSMESIFVGNWNFWSTRV